MRCIDLSWHPCAAWMMGNLAMNPEGLSKTVTKLPCDLYEKQLILSNKQNTRSFKIKVLNQKTFEKSPLLWF